MLCVVGSKAWVWAQGGGVNTSFTKIWCPVPLCRSVAAHHAVVKDRLFVQQVKLAVEPLRVWLVRMLALARTPGLTVRRGGGKVAHSK